MGPILRIMPNISFGKILKFEVRQAHRPYVHRREAPAYMRPPGRVGPPGWRATGLPDNPVGGVGACGVGEIRSERGASERASPSRVTTARRSAS